MPSIGRFLSAPLALAALLLAGDAAAQVALDVEAAGSIERLTDSLSGTQRQGTFTGRAQAEYAFASERAHVLYSLEGGRYPSAGDWSFLLHRFETGFRQPLGDAGGGLGVTGHASLRRNGDAWSSVDYDAVGLATLLDLRPATGLRLRARYGLDARRFAAIAELDQLEHDFSGEALLNLESRTTLVAEARFGFKAYEGTSVVVEVAALGPTPLDGGIVTAADETGAPTPPGQGDSPSPGPGQPGGAPTTPGQGDPGSAPGSPGQGGGESPGTSPGADTGGSGQGPGGMGPPVRPRPPDLGPAGEVHARQVTLRGRIAQSLGDRTGLSAQVTWRNASGDVPPAVVTTPAGFFDDGVYDDPFASDLLSLALRLKHVLGNGGAIEAFATRFLQDYSAAVALGPEGEPLAGDPLREDRVWRAGASVRLPLFPRRTGQVGVALDVGYAYTRSESNDVFYDYRNHAAVAGLSLSY